MPTRSPLAPPHNAPQMGVDNSMTTKRVRKVVNCEPCRVNKLKCNRGRPCSSCELRGTTSQCYQDASPQDFSAGKFVDPLSELEKIRKSMGLLENHFRFSQNSSSADVAGGSPADAHPTRDVSLALSEARTFIGSVTGEFPHMSSPAPSVTGPGAHGRSAGGYYAGPTSTSSHLFGHDVEDMDGATTCSKPSGPIEYDSDVIYALPAPDVIAGFVEYYFNYCQWIYHHVWRNSFRPRWDDYLRGQNSDRLVLATCCGILALTTILIPDGHALKQAMISALGTQPNVKLFELMEVVLARYEVGCGNTCYTLEFVEALYLRTHYLLYSRQNGEEVWAAKSRMMSVAIAMGLHRDPSQWRMPAEIADRRRWLWWTLLSIERWQVFLLGRPHSIANHHFDTQLPRQTLDSAHDSMSYAASIHFFKLTAIAGGITNDALSLMPVASSNLQNHEKSLSDWLGQVPPEWNMSDEQFDRGLCSSEIPVRRVTVQALFVLTTYHLLRLTLHRSFAARPSAQRQIDSAEIAADSAEHLIRLALHCRYDASSPPEHVFAARGLLTFHTFQLFSAAMFFSFHLIAAPTGPRAEQCHRNIELARSALQATPVDAPTSRLAANGAKILEALSPLWEDSFVRMKSGVEKELFKSQLLGRVRGLAFPFHEAQSSRASASVANTHTPDPSMSHDHTDPEMSQLQPDSFGNSGTLMPDMSVSGRCPVVAPDVWGDRAHMNVDPRNNAYSSDMDTSPSSYTEYQSLYQPATMPPGTSSLSMNHGIPYSSALPQRSYLSPSSQTYLAPQTQDNIGGPPAYALQSGNNDNTDGIGGVSQEMVWGASMGIDSGEWAGFVQTMVPQPFSFESEQQHSFHHHLSPTEYIDSANNYQ